MEKIPATAIIHTRNADRYLQEVIDHLKEFDEIMIVDMDSTDRTLEIARENGCRVMSMEPLGYVEPARDPAMRAAKYDWVFFVDADEIIPAELTSWIRKFLDAPGDVKAVGVARKNGFLDKWNRATYPDYQVRLLDRRNAVWPSEVHRKPEIQGQTYFIPRDRLELAMEHKSPSMEEILERMNRYTSLEMQKKQGKKINFWTLWLRPQVRFFKSFILKGGFRHGINGYISAKQDACYQHFYLTKIYERQLKNGKDQR